jgi:beta-barrel assembly-enhancing protease
MPTKNTLSLLASLFLCTACGMSAADERKLGAEAAAEIERRVQVVRDPEGERALATIGNALVEAGGEVAYPYTFRIVRDSSVNAFALPGGFVYVQTGLLRNARDVSELAGVLGHEVAHARLSHGAEQVRKQQGLSAAITVVCLFTGLCDSGLSQVAINLGANVLTAKFSRTDELEADSAGIVYTTSAGVDPRGMIRFFDRLREQSANVPAYFEWISTHPMEGTRITNAERLIGPGAPRGAPAELEAAFALLRARYGTRETPGSPAGSDF